jgi:hypothetical protein
MAIFGRALGAINYLSHGSGQKLWHTLLRGRLPAHFESAEHARLDPQRMRTARRTMIEVGSLDHSHRGPWGLPPPKPRGGPMALAGERSEPLKAQCP